MSIGSNISMTRDELQQLEGVFSMALAIVRTKLQAEEEAGVSTPAPVKGTKKVKLDVVSKRLKRINNKKTPV